MKKIAILGCENSHADAFLKCIKEKEKFRDVSVIGVYSDDSSAAEKLNEKFGVPIMESYADAVQRKSLPLHRQGRGAIMGRGLCCMQGQKAVLHNLSAIATIRQRKGECILMQPRCQAL